MYKQGRSTCAQSENNSKSNILNSNNESKILSDINCTPFRVNLEKQKVNYPMNSNEGNHVALPSFPRSSIHNERKKSEVSNLDANGLDEVFYGMRKRIHSDNSITKMTDEKINILSSMNLIFKNNLPEYTLCEFDNLKIKENTNVNKVESTNAAVPNLKNIATIQTNIVNSKDKLLFATINEGKVDKITPLFNVENGISKKNDNTKNGFINKKRLPQSMPVINAPDKMARNCGITSEKNVEKSKLILGEAGLILNKNNIKLDSLSTDASVSSADVLSPKSNFRQSATGYNEDPIIASPYPNSVNSETLKSKNNSSGNVHFNINITNIVDSNNKFLHSINPLFTSDQYAKIISELKEGLKRKEIIFNEQHSSTNYVLYFKMPHNKTFKQYKFVIDSATSKVIRYEKSKEKEKLVEINNSEDSSALLILHELNSLKKELDLGKHKSIFYFSLRIFSSFSYFVK